MFVRMAGGENLPMRHAYVEFTEQPSVVTALTYNGISFMGQSLR